VAVTILRTVGERGPQIALRANDVATFRGRGFTAPNLSAATCWPALKDAWRTTHDLCVDTLALGDL